MNSPDPNRRRPIKEHLNAVPTQTWVGIIGTLLLALLGLASGGFWSAMLMVALVVLVTMTYGLLFRRRTWLRFPRKRSAAAIGFGIAFAVLIGSTTAYGAVHPETTMKHAQALSEVSETTSASKNHGAHSAKHHHLTKTPATSRPRHTSTPTPTPSPTPIVTTRLVTSTTAIPFTTMSVPTPSLAKGTSRVTTAGKNGVRTTTFRVTLTDGKETGRQQTSQTVTTAPVSQVTSIGTYVAPAPAPVPAPAQAPAPAPAPPVAPGNGATALCNDGALSYAAHHQGACSHHGGVAQFYK
jgi:hypothetical protein